MSARKRGHEDSNSNSNNESKKLKEIFRSIAEEHICPLSQELMVDPVTAEDGHLYERNWIEKVMKTQGENLRSPITSNKMGSRLTPAVRSRNTIENLMKSEMIDEESREIYNNSKLVVDIEKGAARDDITSIRTLASWHESGSHGFAKDAVKSRELRGKAKGLAMKKRAEEGDAEAMWRLGKHHFHGKRGFSKDFNLAYKWCKKSGDLKNPAGMAMAGYCLICGIGVEKNAIYGTSLMSIAAAMGSDYACSLLGQCHFHGTRGFQKNKAEAKHWLTKAVDGSCSEKTLSNTDINISRKLLEEIEEWP